MKLDDTYYEISLGKITLYTDQKDFLDAMVYINAMNQQKLAFNVILDTYPLKIYQHGPDGFKKLCWKDNSPLPEDLEKEMVVLTKTEQMILDLMIQGNAIKKISHILEKSISTINYHLKIIKNKYQVVTTTAALAKYTSLR